MNMISCGLSNVFNFYMARYHFFFLGLGLDPVFLVHCICCDGDMWPKVGTCYYHNESIALEHFIQSLHIC